MQKSEIRFIHTRDSAISQTLVLKHWKQVKDNQQKFHPATRQGVSRAPANVRWMFNTSSQC